MEDKFEGKNSIRVSTDVGVSSKGVKFLPEQWRCHSPPPGSYDTSQAYAQLPELFTLHPLLLLWVDELIKRSGDRTLSSWEVGVLCQRNSWTHPSLTQNDKVGESQWRRCRDKSASLLMLVFICLGTVYVREALTSIHSLRDGVIYWNKAKIYIYIYFNCNYESRFVRHVHHKNCLSARPHLMSWAMKP